jgi:hypothetical protein
MRFRKLRIAWSVAWGSASVLLIMLWVRSYWRYDMLAFPSQSIGLGSIQGELVYSSTNFPSNSWPKFIRVGPQSQQWTVHSESITGNTGFPLMKDGQPVTRTIGFGWFSSVHWLYVFVPHWFLVLVTTAAAFTPWILRKNRFSLRTLLIATTLVAVVLGLAIWAAGADNRPIQIGTR